MRRTTAIIVLFIMIISSIAYAREGDIVHTGLKKIYRADNPADADELLKDILAGADVSRFYEETQDGKYVNMAQKENMQMQKLSEMLRDKGIQDPNDIEAYIAAHKDFIEAELNNAIGNVSIEFDDIQDKGKGNLKDYTHASGPLLLIEGQHYSKPEPGLVDGSTRISMLALPAEASRWLVRVFTNENEIINGYQKDTVITNANPYYRNRDISIEPGNTLALYAVDNSNRLKGYVNIKIVTEMINRPRESAILIEKGNIKMGEKYAGAVMIEGFSDALPNGAVKWQVLVSGTALTKVYMGQIFNEAVDYHAGNEIIVADESELSNIREDFKKYVVLLATDNNGRTVGYNIFEIKKNHLSTPPTLLKANTNYIGPVPGVDDGAMKFAYIGKGTNPDQNMQNATHWDVLISKQPMAIPRLDIDIEVYKTNLDVLLKNIEKDKDLQGDVGDYILLAAADDQNKIKGYKIIQLTENMLKGRTAPPLPEGSYASPVKGTLQGNTMIKSLDLKGISGAVKWMYYIGKDLNEPVFNKTVDGSRDYTAGQNVKASIGDALLLLATDNAGRVMAFDMIPLEGNMIKDPPAVLLENERNYIGPIKGDTEGTTKFIRLSGSSSIGQNPIWMYVVSDEEPPVPELDSVANGEVFQYRDSIGANLSSGQYLLLLATDKDNGKHRVKGYAVFRLTEAHIKMPPAPVLRDGEHFSMPKKGASPGTTEIDDLHIIGIDDFYQWRIRIDNTKYTEPIEYNSMLPGTSIYRGGQDIRANPGDWLILLAVDRIERIKGYAIIELKEGYIRKHNALLLMPNANYTDPEPGTVMKSTRFGFLDMDNIEGAQKWMYKIGNRSFGAIELDDDSIARGALPNEPAGYIKGMNIGPVYPDDYLLLLATDADGKVKGYREFRLTERSIRGGPARVLTEEDNYNLGKGSKPGTTSFTKFTPLGLEGTIRWRYILLDEKLPLGEEPYLNSIIDGAQPIGINQDIQIGHDGYGCILLLAVDNSGRTKGYAQIRLTPDNVREHAPILKIELEKGDEIDAILLANPVILDDVDKYNIVLTDTPYPTPAKDEALNGGLPYEFKDNRGESVKVSLDQYLTIFALSEDNRIKAYQTFKIAEHRDSINLGQAEIVMPATMLEGSINNGGQKIIIKLSNGAQWAKDIKSNGIKREALYNGFKANGEGLEWAKVINSLKADSSGAIDLDTDDILTISLPETKDYDISKDQMLTLTIPPIAMEGAINPINADKSIVIKPTVKATISGDVVDSTIRERDIKTGGKTIIIEIEDGYWAVDINNEANIQTLLKGFKVAGIDDELQQYTNWNIIARSISRDNINRNSSRKITITLPPVEDGLNFGVNKETIYLTIPDSLIQDAVTDAVATPAFTLYPDIIQAAGEAVLDTVELEAPDGKVPREGLDAWIIKLTTGNLKKNITNDDIIMVSLPRGLKASVHNIDTENNRIIIKVSGTGTAKIEDEDVYVRIKGSAIEELNSLDSEDIRLKLKTSESIEEDLKRVDYELRNDVLNVYLKNINDSMQYSTNSTNGVNGTWHDIYLPLGVDEINVGEAKPMNIWVREKAQKRVVHLIKELAYGEPPQGISIKYHDYDNSTVELDITDPETNYEYSTDGGIIWKELEPGQRELNILYENLDFRIRKSAVLGKGGTLPSLSTGKLNGVYLGSAGLNVAKGVIENTSASMEYSIDDGNRFTQAVNGNTPINFAKGMRILLREKGKNDLSNCRELGPVAQMEFSKDEYNSIDYSIVGGTISTYGTELALKDLQYRIGDDPWKEVGDGNKIEYKAGNLQFRKKGDKINLPSEKRPSNDDIEIIIAPSLPAPELFYDDISHTIEKIGTDIGIDYELSIDGSPDWILGNTPIEFKAGQQIRVRKAATKATLPSQIQTIVFTPSLDFSNLYIDGGKGLIVNTNKDMEYSINSTNGLDGEWYGCTSPSTGIPLKTGMNVYIRESKKPGHYKRLTDSPMEERSFNNEIVEHNIGYSIKDKTIWVKTVEDPSELQKVIDYLQYRNGNDWISINHTRLEQNKTNLLAYNVSFRPGKLEFRLMGDKEYLPSKAMPKGTIKAKASPPNVAVDYEHYGIESINGLDANKDWDDFEYSIDNGPWISGRYLKDEGLTERMMLRIRAKATDDELESQETSIDLPDRLPLEHVRLSFHVRPMVLNGTTNGMQYAIWLGNADNNWQYNGEWFDCSNDNTLLPEWLNKEDVYEIVIRDKNQYQNKFSLRCQAP